MSSSGRLSAEMMMSFTKLELDAPPSLSLITPVIDYEQTAMAFTPVTSVVFLISKSLFTTLIPLSGVGTTCFSSCCDKVSAFIFTTGRLPDVNPT
jgi:hypothetical protein